MKRAPIILSAGVLLALASGCEKYAVKRSLVPSPQDWVTEGGDSLRQSRTGDRVQFPWTSVWDDDPGAGVSAQILVRNGVALVSTLKGEFQAFEIQSGVKEGTLALGAPIVATPALGEDAVFIPLSSSGESLVAVDARTGDRRWAKQIGAIESSPLLAGIDLIVTTLDGTAACFRSDDGSKRWEYPAKKPKHRSPIRSSPVTDGRRIFFGSDDGWVYALDRSTGTCAWKAQTGQPVFSAPIVLGDAVVFAGLRGSVTAFAADSGRVRWRYDMGSNIYHAPASNGSSIVCGDAGGVLVALDRNTGRCLWRTQQQSPVGCTPLVSPDRVVAGLLDKSLVVLDIADGHEVWRWTAGGRIRVTPVVWDGTVLVLTDDRTLTAFREGQ